MPDLLTANGDVVERYAPALSATSDMPVVDAAPVVETVETPAETVEAVEAPVIETVTETVEAPVETEVVAEPREPKGVGKALAAKDAMIAEERRRADELATTLREQAETIKRLTEKPPEPVVAESRPRRDEFSDPDAYDDALVEWAGRRAAETVEKTIEEKSAQAEDARKADEAANADRTAREAADAQLRETQNKWAERVAEATESFPDFEAVALSDDVKITPQMSFTIMQLENGPAVAYHLGKTPKEAERIAGLAPPMQIAEIGRLSAIVSTPKPVVARKAPPAPITPLGGSNNAGGEVSLAEMDMDAYAAARLAKVNPRLVSTTRH